VECIFFATEDDVKDAIGRSVWFGEILGKHSEVEGSIEEDDITKFDIDPDMAQKLRDAIGVDTLSGYNPLHYARHLCSKCQDSYRATEFDKEHDMCIYCLEKE
jgi:hypothetical protein